MSSPSVFPRPCHPQLALWGQLGFRSLRESSSHARACFQTPQVPTVPPPHPSLPLPPQGASVIRHLRRPQLWVSLVPFPPWKVLPKTHPSPHWKPQQVSRSSADTSTLTCPLVRMQIRSEMASTAPNACRNKCHPGEPPPPRPPPWRTLVGT